MKSKIQQIIEKTISIQKSYYVCFRLLPFKEAIKLPLLIRYNTKLRRLDGKINFINRTILCRMVEIGFEDVTIFDGRTDRCILDISGTLNIAGKAIMGKGTRICIEPGATLSFGKYFYNSAGMKIICFNNIKFGNKCTVSWDTTIIDTDLHPTIDLKNNIVRSCNGSIIIGNNVWIAMRATILKDSQIPDGSIVACGAIVKDQFEETNILVASSIATIKKRDIKIG